MKDTKNIRNLINVICVLGFPSGLQLDSKYTFNHDEPVGGRYSFDGFTNSKIYFDADRTGKWRLEDLTDSSQYAVTKATGQYPMGTQVWSFDTKVFSGDVELNLNACDVLNEYNCDNGICIDFSKR